MKRRLRSLLRGGEARQRQRALALIRESGLFDVEWYVRTYTESEGAGTDPLHFWLETGWQLGHDPNPKFSVSRYLEDNADVARAGINPLLHFIEFGRMEGRAAAPPEPVWETPDPASFDFPDPAPVFQDTSFVQPVIDWRTNEPNNGSAGTSGKGEPILSGAEDAETRRSLEHAIGQLRELSGAEVKGASTFVASAGYCRNLIDAWYVNGAGLRTRWSEGDRPAVVRAYQIDPLREMAVRRVGEALIVTSLDVADLSLANPLFPILFIWFGPAGLARGWFFLAFPSLCRGGLHYPETMASRSDPAAESSRRARELVALLERQSSPLVGAIAVDIRHGDGSGPLFQRYCRLWLEKVMGVEVAADPRGGYAPVPKFLTDEVAVEGRRRDDRTSVLNLGADMVPTIAVLTTSINARANEDHVHQLPLICAAVGSPSEAILLCPPSRFAVPNAFLSDSAPWNWPTLRGQLAAMGKHDTPAAIRCVRRPTISENQWLLPWANPDLPSAQSASVTWLIEPSKWTSERLKESLEALFAQFESTSIYIGLIGPIDDLLLAIAQALFAKRALRFSTITEAVSAVSTTMAGYVGPNLILHDRRATSFLKWIASQQEVTTSSCVVLNQERRGRQWRSAPIDGGGLHRSGDHSSGSGYGRAIDALWRCTYQVEEPPSDLWLGRVLDVAGWLKGSTADHARHHWCTALVSAAKIEADEKGNPEFGLLSSATTPDRATSYDVFS